MQSVLVFITINVTGSKSAKVTDKLYCIERFTIAAIRIIAYGINFEVAIIIWFPTKLDTLRKAWGYWNCVSKDRQYNTQNKRDKNKDWATRGPCKTEDERRSSRRAPILTPVVLSLNNTNIIWHGNHGGNHLHKYVQITKQLGV